MFRPSRKASRSSNLCAFEALEDRTLRSVSPDPGGTFASAYNLGNVQNASVLSPEGIVVRDFVGSADRKDMYRIVAPQGRTTIQLAELSNDADLYVWDQFGNYIADSGRGGRNIDKVTLDTRAGDAYFLEVRQFSGDTNYTLSVAASGNSLDARDFSVGDVFGKNSIVGRLDDQADRSDTYWFHVNERSALTLTWTESLTAPLNVTLLNQAGSPLSTRTLDPGYYALTLSLGSGGGDTSYVMNISLDTGPDQRYLARTIGAVDGGRSLVDFVGAKPPDYQIHPWAPNAFYDRNMHDPDDYYSFTSSSGGVTANLSGLSGNADLQILDSRGQLVGMSANAGSANETLSLKLVSGKAYYCRVFTSGDETNYHLSLAGADTAGNSTLAAKDLGVLNRSPVRFTDFIGKADPSDYYRFDLSTATDVSILLSNMVGDADLVLQDKYGNVFRDSRTVGMFDERISMRLTAGTYFVHVMQRSGDTNYNLAITAS